MDSFETLFKAIAVWLLASCFSFGQPNIISQVAVKKLSPGPAKIGQLAALAKAEKSECIHFYQGKKTYPAFTVLKIDQLLNSKGDIQKTDVSSEVITTRPSSYETASETMIREMIEVHDYTTTENGVKLMTLDRVLDPRRVSYISIETVNNQRAGLRIVDGSHVVKALWGDNFLKPEMNSDSAIPIELTSSNAHEYLPAQKERYLWELGLVNSDPRLQESMSFLMSQVAMELDARYNNGDYLVGRSKELQDKNFKIVLQTRESTMAFFENFGFRAVQRNSKNFKLSSGLYLMEVSGDEFLKINYHGRIQMTEKGGRRIYTQDKLDQARDAGRDRLLSILNEENLTIERLDQIRGLGVTMAQRLNLVANLNSPNEKRQAALMFIINYLIVIKSIPESLRGEDWKPLYELSKGSFFMSDPVEAFEYFISVYQKMYPKHQGSMTFGERSN